MHEGMPKCDPCFLLRAGCWYTEKPAKRNYDVWYDTHNFTRGKSRPARECLRLPMPSA